MAIRAILLDIDGTLTNRKKQITPKTKEALMKAQEHGIRLVLASGRPTSGIMDFGRELEMDRHHGIFVSFNGSRVIDCETGGILFNQTMTVEQGRTVLEHMKHFNVIPMIDKGEYLYVNDVFSGMLHNRGREINIIHHEARGGKFKLCEIDDLAAFADYPLNKILTAGEPEYLEAHWQEMMAPFQGVLNGMFTSSVYYEFTALGIDKATALDTVLRPMGILPENMIAFGDGQNDASMVQYAGIGVAMGNAVPELKAVADEVTLSNEEDGIAESLRLHLPELF